MRSDNSGRRERTRPGILVCVLCAECNKDDRYGKKEAGTGEHLRHFNNKINQHK